MTNKQRKVAVFDIDGTILDSMPKMRADIKSAFRRLGYTVNDEQIAQQKGWYGLAEALEIKRENYDLEFDKRKSWEQSLADGEAPLFMDTLPCLEDLASQGFILAALTKSDPKYTKEKIDYHKLNRFFGDRIAVTPVDQKSKKVEAIELIRRIGVSPYVSGIKKGSPVYFIGDRVEDVIVAEDVYKASYSNPGFQDGLFESYIMTNGIWLNREGKSQPQELNDYRTIKSLAELPAIIGT